MGKRRNGKRGPAVESAARRIRHTAAAAAEVGRRREKWFPVEGSLAFLVRYLLLGGGGGGGDVQMGFPLFEWVWVWFVIRSPVFVASRRKEFYESADIK